MNPLKSVADSIIGSILSNMQDARDGCTGARSRSQPPVIPNS